MSRYRHRVSAPVKWLGQPSHRASSRCYIIKVSEHFPEYSRNGLRVCALPLGQEAVLRAITGTIEMPKKNDSF